ncbi:MAG: hypothetical protein ACERKO_01310 [Acetanaerobacterium sp.]
MIICQKIRVSVVLLLLPGLVLLQACGGNFPDGTLLPPDSERYNPSLFPQSQAPQDDPQPVPDDVPTDLSVWVAYWRLAGGMPELAELAPRLSSVNVFAAHFDSENRLFVAEEFEDVLPDIAALCTQNDAVRYLTLVNDRVNPNGSYSLKDDALLRELLATERTRTAHTEEIAALLIEGGYGGVEVDYERMPDDLWGAFSLFLAQLYDRLSEEGLTLRVVLESDLPEDAAALPEGPEYAVMVYNLYGQHGGPGPKADIAFIKDTASRAAALPGDVRLAFAAGGFDWAEGAPTEDVTGTRAEELAHEYGASSVRDSASGCLYFDYTAPDGTAHTVWYSDEQTLTLWIETARASGCKDIALWVLGGNTRDTIACLAGLR